MFEKKHENVTSSELLEHNQKSFESLCMYINFDDQTKP